MNRLLFLSFHSPIWSNERIALPFRASFAAGIEIALRDRNLKAIGKSKWKNRRSTERKTCFQRTEKPIRTYKLTRRGMNVTVGFSLRRYSVQERSRKLIDRAIGIIVGHRRGIRRNDPGEVALVSRLLAAIKASLCRVRESGEHSFGEHSFAESPRPHCSSSAGTIRTRGWQIRSSSEKTFRINNRICNRHVKKLYD